MSNFKNNLINVADKISDLPLFGDYDHDDFYHADGDYVNARRESILSMRMDNIAPYLDVFRSAAAMREALYNGALINAAISHNFNYMLKSECGGHYDYYLTPSLKGKIISSCGAGCYYFNDLFIDMRLNVNDDNLNNDLYDMANDLNDDDLYNFINYIIIKDHAIDDDLNNYDLRSLLNAAGVNPFILLDIYKKAGRDCSDILLLLS